MADESDFQLQNSAKAIEFARDGIRSGILINGGGAVAVLALLSGQGASVSLNIKTVKSGLWYFAVGVLVAFIACVVAYIAQTLFAMHNQRKCAGEVSSGAGAVIVSGIAVGLIVAGAACFVAGAWHSAQGLSAVRKAECGQEPTRTEPVRLPH